MGHQPNIIRDSEDLVREEQRELGNWRKARGRENQPWTGIALSGGGIRSATFCLGVLQALANKDRLKHFDYISTVSGGGYTGCSLQWWWCHQHRPNKTPSHGVESELGTGKRNFPFGTSEPGPTADRDDPHKQARLKRLRDHANYLAPGGGINYWSGVGAVLRSMLLNLLVWVPLVGVVFFTFAWLDLVIKPGWQQVSVVEPALPFLSEQAPALFKFALLAVASIIVLFLISCTLYSLVSTHEEGQIPEYSIIYLSGAFALAIILWLIWSEDLFTNQKIFGVSPDTYRPPVFTILILAIVALSLKAISKLISGWFPKGIGEAYQYRRFMDVGFGRSFAFIVLLLALSLIPLVSKHISSASPTADIQGFLLGFFAVGTGTAASLWGYYQLFRNYAPRLATSVFLPVGGAAFLAGIAILGYYFGVSLYNAIYTDNLVGGIGSPPPPSLLYRQHVHYIVLVLIAMSLISALIVNINQISLNRFYRDRLMEAYMPGKDSIYRNTRESSPADTLSLSDLWPRDRNSNRNDTRPSRRGPPGPYPLINTNVVLVNDADPKLVLRGGDNFVLAPYLCGSKATGWSKTKKAFPQLSLATAMAASAAAVNPFAGYVGTGPTRNRIVSVVLALLNLRLGVWVRNPAKHFRLLDKLHLLRYPNHIVPGLWYAVTRRGHRHNNFFLELTDGGHFDNLALYELVRRKCKVILVCDGEMDRKTSYAALVSVQRRIKDDFKAHIEFYPDQGPELLVENKQMNYPADAFMSKETSFVAKIVYEDESIGQIIYVKARMIEELSFEVKAYKGAHMDFPHESTSDQFFDPEQFDAHCELGYRACMRADSSIEAVLGNSSTH